MSPGEKRRRAAKREREKLAYESAMSALRVTGATCGSCKHYSKGPAELKERICGLHSDSDGYVTIKATDLCPAYKDRHP